jgi:hypothetical protein
MEDQFPVNSGNVPPPSQSTNVPAHQMNFATAFQTANRRKHKETLSRSTPKV